MKRILVSSFSVLAILMAGATIAQAQSADTTPFNLFNLARNGYFQEQGIPSFSGLHAAVESGKITAEDIIQAAVQQNRLSSEHLNDAAYIRSVRRFLNDMNGD
jgi:hypothetical protein